MIGYSDTGTSNIHEVRSSGLLKSTFQVACSLYSNAIAYNSGDPFAGVGSWLTEFDYPYDRLAPPFIGPFGTNIQLKSPNSIYMVSFWCRGPRDVTFGDIEGYMDIKLNHYDSAAVTLSQVLQQNGKSSFGFQYATATALVQTSSNVGDYVQLQARYQWGVPQTAYADFKIFVARIA